MLPLRIKGATRVLAESQDEYHALAIKDELLDGHPVMVSRWEPTPRELKVLNEGGAVSLSIMGTIHPPVLIGVVSGRGVDVKDSG